MKIKPKIAILNRVERMRRIVKADTQRTQVLTQLGREGANLMDPESVKQVVANRRNWSNGYKKLLISSYSKFAEMLGLKWEKPSYKRVGELPFIPLEKEIDNLIAGYGKNCNPPPNVEGNWYADR